MHWRITHIGDQVRIKMGLYASGPSVLQARSPIKTITWHLVTRNLGLVATAPNPEYSVIGVDEFGPSSWPCNFTGSLEQVIVFVRSVVAHYSNKSLLTGLSEWEAVLADLETLYSSSRLCA